MSFSSGRRHHELIADFARHALAGNDGIYPENGYLAPTREAHFGEGFAGNGFKNFDRLRSLECEAGIVWGNILDLHVFQIGDAVDFRQPRQRPRLGKHVLVFGKAKRQPFNGNLTFGADHWRIHDLTDLDALDVLYACEVEKLERVRAADNALVEPTPIAQDCGLPQCPRFLPPARIFIGEKKAAVDVSPDVAGVVLGLCRSAGRTEIRPL